VPLAGAADMLDDDDHLIDLKTSRLQSVCDCSSFAYGFRTPQSGLADGFRRHQMTPAGEERPAMGRISFTTNLERHLTCPPVRVGGGTIREVLDEVFAGNPQLRSYLVDEHGRLRRHVNVYVNEDPVADRIGLSDTVSPEDDIYVFQALSGG
jgi:sulfur-carrier protein